MVSVLSICENPIEIESIVPVADKIENLSAGRIAVDVATQDALHGLGADKKLESMGREKTRLPYPARLSTPFLGLPWWKKAQILFSTDRTFRSVVQEYNAFICGTDSVAARILISAAQEVGKPTFQVFVSMNYGNTDQKTVIRKLKDVARYTLGHLTGRRFLKLPNRDGGTRCDRLFVMGRRNEDVFCDEGMPRSRIRSYGIPRFAPLFEEGQNRSKRRNRILYITGPFAWHDWPEAHRVQQQQVRSIADSLADQPTENGPEFVVRLHPRESGEYYDWLEEYEQVEVESANADLYDSIHKSLVVATICSTVAYEASLLGRVVLLTRFPRTLEDFGPPGMRSDFLEVSSAAELLEETDTLRDDSRYENVLGEQKENTEEVIDPRTPNSDKLIAEEIINYLENE
ncbi:hypothetical protein GGP50_001640 [Salinibacter ruber]|uniref:hypothetical protein n=1 Tax=Salinibacter ruber TaxID=146919 RepID=UPI00216AA52E|nr:hypothetical protein [Salinibacter ruber]MCS4193419.1 hypothetical protein [Salinibacter ruber]